jgi:hypothetical protein
LAFEVGVNLSRQATDTESPARPEVHSVNRKMVEAVVSVVDARLWEHTAQFEQRLGSESAALRIDCSEQIAACQERTATEILASRAQMVDLDQQFAQSISKLVEEQIASAIEARIGGLVAPRPMNTWMNIWMSIWRIASGACMTRRLPFFT